MCNKDDDLFSFFSRSRFITRSSFSASSWLVPSSKIRTCLSWRITRIITRSCLWPPERSISQAIGVSNQSLSERNFSVSPKLSRRFHISSSDGIRVTPSKRLSLMVKIPSKINGSWLITEIICPRLVPCIVRISVVLYWSEPWYSVKNQSIWWISVVFPAPFLPTSPYIFQTCKSNEISLKITGDGNSASFFRFWRRWRSSSSYSSRLDSYCFRRSIVILMNSNSSWTIFG